MAARGLTILTAIAVLAAAPASAAPRALGFNIHQSSDVGPAVTHDAGAGWVRIDVNWLDIERSAGVFDWTVIDGVVAAARARNLSVLAVLAYGPAWASAGDTKGDGPNNDVPLPGTYAAFVGAAVTRYQADVTAYELWNEPNLGQFFEGAPQDYLDRVLVPGADAVHAACAGCKVVGPALSSLIASKFDVWLDAVLAQAAGKLDIVSGHLYAGFPQDGAGADHFYNRLEKHYALVIDGVTLLESPRSFKEVLDARGVKKPFWVTEVGYEAALGDAPALARQATYYRRVLESMLVRDWWQATFFYEGFDEPPAPYHFGVAVHDASQATLYRPKPALAVLQKATARQPAFGGSGGDCDDGLDNDDDGAVDFPADTDCVGPATPSEGAYLPWDADLGAPPDAATPAAPSGCEAEPTPLPSSAVLVALVVVLALALVTRARRRSS